MVGGVRQMSAPLANAEKERIVNMYHMIVKKIARKNFERVNQHDYNAILASCDRKIRHRFGGNHALGGVRHTREALQCWFARLGRVMPNLHISVEDVWVKGWPHKTVIIIRWEAIATLNDGSPYQNRGVHVIRMRWGKVTDVDAHEDSQTVAASLSVQAQNGIPEAAFEPIVN
jgi:ketosteroid isomerase-like protein